jgi:catechol 2,3-dioxygenase-like lactoylglutathione lyase family enzyme
MNLNQVTLPVTNLETAIAFYKQLGMRLIVRSEANGYARFECPDSDATFSLHTVTALPAGEGAWIYFELQDLDDTVTFLKQKGMVFDEGPEDKPWLWREARLKDPDGNRLILYNAGENRKNPPWRLE